MTVFIRGNVILSTPAAIVSANMHKQSLHIPKKLLIKTTQDIPCSLWIVGKTSAEYWNGREVSGGLELIDMTHCDGSLTKGVCDREEVDESDKLAGIVALIIFRLTERLGRFVRLGYQKC